MPSIRLRQTYNTNIWSCAPLSHVSTHGGWTSSPRSRVLCLCATALPSLLAQSPAENTPSLQVSARKGSAWDSIPRARQQHEVGASSSQHAEELSFSTAEVPVFHIDSSCTASQGTGQCWQSPCYRGRLGGFAQKMHSFIDFTGHVNVLHKSSLKSWMMRVHGSWQKIRRAGSKRLFTQQLVDL